MESPPDKVRIRVTPQKNAPELVPRVFEGISPGLHDLRLEVDRGVWVGGRVTDEDGDPLEAFVRQVTDDDHLGDRWVRSGEDGAFRIAVAPGVCRLYANAESEGVSVSPVIEVRAPASGVRLVCPPTCTVRGRLVGRAVDRFVVAWRLPGGLVPRDAGAVEVSPDGSFEIGDLPRGPVVLVARATDDPRCALAKVDARDGTEVELVLDVGLEITGWVRSSWADMRQCSVQATNLEHRVWWWCTPAPDGSFRLEGLLPGRYRLHAAGTGMQRLECAPTTVDAGAEGVELVIE
jgi:hypothetical protein